MLVQEKLVCFKLSNYLKKKLDEFAKKKRISRSKAIRQFIETSLNTNS